MTQVLSKESNEVNKKRQTIRFYNLNKKKQLNRLIIRKKRLEKAGCHNFSGTKKIYRLTQIGYKYCQLFSTKNCTSGSEIQGSWKEKKLSMQFTQGGEWLFIGENSSGVKAKSWLCNAL